MNNKYFIFQIQGGLGKHIMATALLELIKEKHPDRKIVILCAYPVVFYNNPLVHRCYGFGEALYFFDTYIKNQDFILAGHDPYLETSHITGEKHLLESWSDLMDLGVPTGGAASLSPDLFLTSRELEFTQNLLDSTKPIMVVQISGGAQQQQKVSWARDIPQATAQLVVEHFKKSHNIYQIRREDQPALRGVTGFLQGDMRVIFAAIAKADKLLLMDSFAQHAAAALGKKATVLWIANKPEVFGWETHHNITCQIEDLWERGDSRHSVLHRFNIMGDTAECPYPEGTELFDVDQVIGSLAGKKLKKVAEHA